MGSGETGEQGRKGEIGLLGKHSHLVKKENQRGGSTKKTERIMGGQRKTGVGERPEKFGNSVSGRGFVE